MKLKVGDLIAFKNYEDMTDEERCGISEKNFPEFGKVSKIYDSIGFRIKGNPYIFNEWSIDHVISGSDADDIHAGDEVLIKATVNSTYDNVVWLEPLAFKEEVVKVLKHKEEHFIVQEDKYKMYVINSKSLSLDKSKAKIYNSRNEANEEAADMHLNAWEVIPYDN